MAQNHNDVTIDRVQIAQPALVKRMAALGVALALILAACGTPANQGAPAAPAATTAPAAPAATTAPAAPAATTAPAAEPTAASAGGAAATGGTATGVTDSEIVIGSWGPQDGPAGAYGVIDRTIAAYFKMVNEQGGINGRQIRFVYENDSYQPAKTVAAVKKLVEEDKVFALIAGLGTPNNMAVMDYLVENDIPHFAPATGSTLMAKPLKKNVFALQVNYNTEATLLARYAVETLGSKKVEVFYQNDAFGKEGFDSVNAVLKEKGLPEAAGVTYETSDTNYSSQALKLQTSGADTVVIWAVPKPGGGIIAEMDKIGYAPKLLASAVINDPAIFKLAGAGIEGLITTAWLPDFRDTSNPKIAEYQEFMKKYAPEEQIGGFTLSGYTEAQFMVEVLKRVGKDLTRESFIKTLEGITSYTDGVLPDVGYGPDDRQGSESIFFQQAKDGQFVKISDWQSLK